MCKEAELPLGASKYCKPCRVISNRITNRASQARRKKARTVNKCKECKVNPTFSTHCNKCAQVLAVRKRNLSNSGICERCTDRPKWAKYKRIKYCLRCRDIVILGLDKDYKVEEQSGKRSVLPAKLSTQSNNPVKEIVEESSGLPSKFLERGTISYAGYGSIKL
jgi:hypothetical protein